MKRICRMMVCKGLLQDMMCMHCLSVACLCDLSWLVSCGACVYSLIALAAQFFCRRMSSRHPQGTASEVDLNYGIFEIFTRFTPKEGQPCDNVPVKTLTVDSIAPANVPMPPPGPPPLPPPYPPPGSETSGSLPPLPPPQTPHPDVLKDVAKQMLSLKDTVFRAECYVFVY